MRHTTSVLRMPGVHCQLYAVGHCLYEERLNPGFEGRWRCRELIRLTVAYDKLIDQGECFSLSEAEVSALWKKRCTEMPAPGEGCDTFTPPPQGCAGCGKKGCGDSSSSSDRETPGELGNAPFSQSGLRQEVDLDALLGLNCIYTFGSACVLLMPSCEGVCARFAHRKR